MQYFLRESRFILISMIIGINGQYASNHTLVENQLKKHDEDSEKPQIELTIIKNHHHVERDPQN